MIARLFVRTCLTAVVPIAFGYGLFECSTYFGIHGFFSYPTTFFLFCVLIVQGHRNSTEYLADRRVGLSKRSPVWEVVSYSWPFFASLATALSVYLLDQRYEFFSPWLTGTLAGALTFLLAYNRIALGYGPITTKYISGQRILSTPDVLTRAKKLGYTSGLRFGGIEIPANRATTHFLIVGATGSGKTLTVHQLLKDIGKYLRQNPSAHAVVYDPKQSILPLLKDIASDLPVTDFHPYREGSFAWDLARDIRTSQDIESLSNILLPEEKSSENRFFVDAPRELVQSVLRCFLESGVLSWNFRDLYCILNSSKLLAAMLSASDSEKEVFSEYFKGDPRTLSNVRLSLRTRLLRYRVVAAASQQRILNDKKISLREWSSSRGGFFVLGSDKTPDSGIDALNRAAMAMLGRCWLEGSSSGGAPKHFLVLDEVQSAGQISVLPALLTEGREKGVATILALQDVASMRHVYGKDQSDALMSQFGNKAFLRLEGDSTAEWASKTIGETEQYEYTRGVSLQGPPTVTRNEQRVRRAALMPADFLTIPTTNKANGLTGYYSSAEIGLWKHTYEAKEIFDDTAHYAEQVTNANSDTQLEPFGVSDLERLKIAITEPSTEGSPKKQSPSKKLGDVTRFDLNED